jgi:perosamine synthetase
MIKKQIKLFDPYIDDSEINSTTKVLKSNFWASGSGDNLVAKFESKFNNFVGANHSIGLNSGTAALHLALSLFDIRNKEVILPSLSFVSTAHAVIYNGGKPVFVDVDENTLCINPDLLDEKINSKTKIILPVHFAGYPSNLKKIQKLTRKNGLYLVEDAAHAAGSIYDNKRIGSHGDAVCFSFHPVKNLAMPNGGAISINTTNSEYLAKKLKILRWCGISERNGVNYNISELGWNYYMDEISAAIGLEQLKKLNKMNSKRKFVAKRYSEELQLENKLSYNKDCSYHFYWIRVKNRSKFMAELRKHKIETGIHYKPIHTMKYYNTKKKLPITEKIGSEIVSIPTHPNLTDDDVSYIIKCINKYS